MWSSPSRPGPSCAALLDFGGHRYTGHGELKRDPETTGRTATGTVPGCEDGNGAAPTRQVKVVELADIGMRRAVLVDGTLYVRTDRPFPATARAWFVAPRCEDGGRFELAGEWLSAQGGLRPRYDGDLRPPYRIGVHVTRGPRRYVASTVQLHVTRHTRPALSSKDAKASLRRGGTVTAEVRCVDGRFVTTSVTSRPG